LTEEALVCPHTMKLHALPSWSKKYILKTPRKGESRLLKPHMYTCKKFVIGDLIFVCRTTRTEKIMVYISISWHGIANPLKMVVSFLACQLTLHLLGTCLNLYWKSSVFTNCVYIFSIFFLDFKG
jgi:hypothetical protein